jgi:predicted transcriptional regulator
MKDHISTPDPEHLAAFVRASRALLGWSQSRLAAKANLTQRSISKIEDCLVTTRPSTAFRLLNVLAAAGLQFKTLPRGGLKITAHRKVLRKSNTD